MAEIGKDILNQKKRRRPINQPISNNPYRTNRRSYNPNGSSQRNKQYQNITKQMQARNRYLKNKNETSKKLAKMYNTIFNGILMIVGAVFVLRKSFEHFGQGGASDYEGSGLSSGRMSDKGIHDLLQYESFDPVAVDREGDGILTIGYGHKGKEIKKGQTITRDEAYKLFQSDLISRERAVNRMVKVPISQNMFDALVSFVYNAGEGSLAKSKILERLNKGDYQGAAEAWKTQNIRAGSKFEKGLRNRRAKEAATFSIDIGADNKLKAPSISGANVGQKGGKIKGYRLKDKVEISDAWKSVLNELNGSGIVTSGMEKTSTHTAGSTHGLGYKVDMVPNSGYGDRDWIELAVPLLLHPNMEYVSFEAFSVSRFNKIKNEMFRIYPQVKTKCEQNPGLLKRTDKNAFTTGLHLDIKLKSITNYQPSTNVNKSLNNSNKAVPQSKPQNQNNQSKNQSKATSNNTNKQVQNNQNQKPVYSASDRYSPLQTSRNSLKKKTF